VAATVASIDGRVWLVVAAVAARKTEGRETEKKCCCLEKFHGRVSF
jgi:hypothetical protein